MRFYFICLFVLLTVSSCGLKFKSVQEAAALSNSQVEQEPEGSNCEYGGKKISVGSDYDGDGKLELSELSSVKFACNSQGKFEYLSLEFNEPAGTNCEEGGRVVKGGTDLDSDGVLGGEEVQDVKYFCNDSADYKALVSIVNEPVGDNCPLGGVNILSGLDISGDGILDQDEVKESIYKCSEEVDFEALVSVLTLEAGSVECPLGGTKVLQGLDINKNGALDENEIKQSLTLLTCMTPENFPELSKIESIAFDSQECPLGGERTLSGRDVNSSGVLDEQEIISKTVSCKSNSDFNGLVVVKELPFKDANCHLGGKQTVTGLDYNSNGVMDDNEINEQATTYSCYSESDYNRLALESDEPMGQNCIYGGTKTEKGLDYNRDGVLNPDEIDPSLTGYNCLGAGDFNTLIVVTEEPLGSTDCALGGKKTETGLDLDKDGVLAQGEVTSTVFGCYSVDHFNLLNIITEEPFGSNCTWGGNKVEQGRDYNNNGILDNNELDADMTAYKCYAPEDFDLIVRAYDEPKGDNCQLGGTRTEKGRDTNSNALLDAMEVNPSLTTYTCTVSFERSKIAASSMSVASGSSVAVSLSLVDQMGIAVKRSGINVAFLYGGGTSIGEFGPVVDNGDGTYSSLFTGLIAGTPVSISAIVEGQEIITDRPMVSVVVGDASYMAIEDKADGTGKVVEAINVVGNKPVTLYAISRDTKGNFVANEAVNWSISSNIGLLSPMAGPSTTLSPKAANGVATIRADHDVLGTDTTGDIKVSWDGLLVSLSFEDNMLDSSGNGNEAVNYGGAFTDGKVGRAMSFNGVLVSGQSYFPHVTIKDKDVLDMTKAGTLSAWINMDRYTNYGGIIMKGNGIDFKDEAYSLQLFSSGNKQSGMNVRTNNDNIAYSANDALGKPATTGKWFYLVGVWDNSSVRIYIDGVLKGSNSKAISAQVTTGDLHIGALIAGTPYPKKTDKSAFVGKIDEVTVWNRALSIDEISYLYNDGGGR